MTPPESRSILLFNMELCRNCENVRSSRHKGIDAMNRIHKSLKVAVVASVALTVLGLTSSCGKKEDKKLDTKSVTDNRYANWKSVQFQNIKILYPVNHPQESTFTEMGQAYIYLQRKLQEILGFPAITDTITVYYYTGYGQGRELTTQEYPFADSTTIHFWLPSFYGPPMMQYLLPRWAPDPPKNKFLKHGLISLFDLSGQKYHESTIGYINGKSFIPLDSLVRDTSTNSNLERYQSGEAASFCAFIIGQYGPQALKDLYICPQPFDVCVRQTLMTSVDTLQSLWLGFVRMNVPKDSLHN